MDSQPWSGRALHFIGVGGCGMSGLALVARSLGARVTGSDRRDSPFLRPLRDRGVEVFVGHDPAKVPGGAGVELVCSSAVLTENSERERGRERGLREIHRGDLLAEVAALRRCIAVSGTHGKTTTAAMIAHVLRAAGLRPGYVIGGTLLSTGLNAEWDEGEWLVVETDESDRSLLALHPEVAVLTNVELEHVRTYASRDEVAAVFRAFLGQARHAVLWDRPDVLALSSGPVTSFDACEPRLAADGSRFGWGELEVHVPAPGEHNARNAAAALAACALTGADPARSVAALASYAGTARRLQLLGTMSCGARVYDDYAHHPTAIQATLAAVRTLGADRVVAVIEPHSYARVGRMVEEFGAALAQADLALVLPVVAGRGEDPRDYPGVDASLIAGAAGAGAVAVAGADAAETRLRRELREGELCITLGGVAVDVIARRLVA